MNFGVKLNAYLRASTVVFATLVLTGCGANTAATLATATPLGATGLQSSVAEAGKVSAQTPTPVSARLRDKSRLGINVSTVAYWSGERALANLLTGSAWVNPNTSWTEYPAARIDQMGNMIALNTGEVANRLLTPPAAAFSTTARIRCTFSGKGLVRIAGAATAITTGANSLDFSWPSTGSTPGNTWIELRQTDAADPIRNLDCREADLPQTEVFAPEFIDSIKTYGVIRFLDWSKANANANLTWATRTLPGSLAQTKGDGVALEHMVALANATKADPWFTISWNADEDYIRRFAEYVRDNLDPDSRAYVEFSNEVWNGQFAVAAQAQREGLAAGLSANAFEAQLRRYAEKSAWALDIWKQVFVNKPERLVRVLSAQHDNEWTGSTIIGFRDTKDHFDAFATAPYFSHSLFSGALAGVTDLNAIYPIIEADAQRVLTDKGCKNLATALRYGKRYIAYEAGQHVTTSPTVSLLASINRDARIGSIYDAYLAKWNSNFNDVMMLYNSTAGISQYGAWGLREFAGQPIAQTPKRRAALEAAQLWSRVAKTDSMRCT